MSQKVKIKKYNGDDVRRAEGQTRKRVSRYIKSAKLYPEEKEHIPISEKFKSVLSPYRGLYRALTPKQKVTLHMIAPLWANVLQYGMEAKEGVLITDNKGNKYNLNSMNSTTCLVGEAYGFQSSYNCPKCHSLNMQLAVLGDNQLRYLKTPVVQEFLDHYADVHLKI